jgi:D-alanyl-D-alanine carboxypeptidase (penicillin-binding protein 5/6)
MTERPPGASPLQGGTLRRPRRRRLAVLGLLLLALAGGGIVAGQEDGGTPRPDAVGVVEPEAKPRPSREDRAEVEATLPPGIALAPNPDVRIRFKRPPRAAVLLDVDSGELLWAHKPLNPVPIASLTKVMTALLVIERIGPRAKTRISKEATRFRGSGVGVLPRGRKVPVEALLYGLLLPSGNDAAVALAEAVAGSDRRFARLMTRRAEQLGLGCTRYTDSYGLRSGNRSCAADLAALTRLVLRQPRIARIVRQAHANVPFPIKGRRLDVRNTNPLLRAPRYPGTIGLKTGYTKRAGHCLIAVARRGDRTLAAILLNSPNTRDQARRMLDAGFRASA